MHPIVMLILFVYTAPVPEVEKTVPDCRQTVQGVYKYSKYSNHIIMPSIYMTVH